MKFRKYVMLGLFAIVLVAAGCTGVGKSGTQGDQEQLEQEQPEQEPDLREEEQPLDGHEQQDDYRQPGDGQGKDESQPYDLPGTGSEAVVISLSGEPRIISPIQTVVAPSVQKYILQFADSMKRNSVEMVIQNNLVGPPGSTFKFDWQSDTLLHLDVQVPTVENDSIDDFGQRSYSIDVNGAQTQSGAMLQNPPSLRAVIIAPKQLWRISADGKKKEQLGEMDEPYHFRMLPLNDQYVVAERFLEYCECDATLPYLYAIYDLKQRQLISYPLDITLNYMGKGDFFADLRGFFYAKPEAGVKVPNHEQSVHIQIDGYVRGSAFSRDGRYVIAAVARDEEQTKDLDLVTIDLQTGKESGPRATMIGHLEESMVSSALLPVQFQDDGRHVYFTMSDPDSRELIFSHHRYRYEWETKTISGWEAPLKNDEWPGFTFSSDRVYQLYANAGLFKNNQKIDVAFSQMPYPAHWLPQTHSFIYNEYVEASDGHYVSRLSLYDADRGEQRAIVEQLPMNSSVIGISSDGLWVYLQTSHPF